MRPTPLELARLAAGRLARESIENVRLEAELLLAGVLGVRRLDLYLQFDRPLGEAEVERYREAVRRRLRREPVQYILGETGFRELTLATDRRALIPRPETEVLVGEVLAWARQRTGCDLTALDIGTGTGAIALSLLREGPFARVVATDVSEGALDLARENALRAELTAGLELRRGSLFEPLHRGERFDVIVSNPPYIAEADRYTLPPEVREWEPAVALFGGGEDGAAVLGSIVGGAAEWLHPGGLLALEVGADQAATVAAGLDAQSTYGPARVQRDLAARERIVTATRIAEPKAMRKHA